MKNTGNLKVNVELTTGNHFDAPGGTTTESSVVSALYSAYASGVDLGTEGIATELAATVPLSRSRAEDLQRLRAWAGDRALAA